MEASVNNALLGLGINLSPPNYKAINEPRSHFGNRHNDDYADIDDILKPRLCRIPALEQQGWQGYEDGECDQPSETPPYRASPKVCDCAKHYGYGNQVEQRPAVGQERGDELEVREEESPRIRDVGQ